MPLLHISCRDKNLIGLQSELMGIAALGIRHILPLTGDPAKFGDQPGASSVYDVNSIQLMEIISGLNKGYNFAGKNIKYPTDFVIGCTFNPNAKNLDAQIARLERKIAAGARYVMTQPVFDQALVQQMHARTKHLGVPILTGIWPLLNAGKPNFYITKSRESSSRTRFVPAWLEPKDSKDAVKVSKSRKTSCVPLWNISRASISSPLFLHMTPPPSSHSSSAAYHRIPWPLIYSRRRFGLGRDWIIRRIHKISDRRLDRKCAGIYPTARVLERRCLPDYLRSLQLVVVAGRRPQYGRRLLFWPMVGFLPGIDRKSPRERRLLFSLPEKSVAKGSNDFFPTTAGFEFWTGRLNGTAGRSSCCHSLTHWRHRAF